MASYPRDMHHVSAIIPKALVYHPKALAENCTDFYAPPIKKQQARAFALRTMPILGFCSGCGGDAIHRHSPSSHAIRGDEFGLCAACHRAAHTGQEGRI